MFYRTIRSTVVSLLILVIMSVSLHAETLVASAAHLKLIQNRTDRYTDATATGTKSLNPIQILKLNTSVTSLFQSDFPDVAVLSSSKKPYTVVSKNFANEVFAQLDETGYGYSGQCVAFAKAMVESRKTTKTWYAGTRLGDIPLADLETHLMPGTMIAFFDGHNAYNDNKNHHVAIFLSVQKDAQGNPIGITVIDQNFVNGYSTKIGGITYSRDKYEDAKFNAIAIHNFAWTVTGKNHLSASEYSIVDVR